MTKARNMLTETQAKACERMDIAMTHDDLAAEMGPAYQKMLDAGFVMMPRKWREQAFEALSDYAKLKRERQQRSG